MSNLSHVSTSGSRWLPVTRIAAAKPTPLVIWLGVTSMWPVVVALVHLGAEWALGPVDLPFPPARFAWTALATGSLLGTLAACRAALRAGALADLHELRPILPVRGAKARSLELEIVDVSPVTRRWVTGVGLAGGLAMATLDPFLKGLYEHVATTDPRYVFFVLQNMLLGVLGTRLGASEVHMTRAFARLGETLEIDLLNPSTTLVFGRKGLRSVAVSVLISVAISMFWLLDSAGQSNVLIPFVVLGLATAALLAPTLGVRRNVARTKARELEVVVEAIRRERDRLLEPGLTSSRPHAGRLGDLVRYESLVRSVREWPFDLSIVSRSALFILLGAGSWVGGAMVERGLGVLLD